MKIMSQLHDVVTAWLNNVAYSHSQSVSTAYAYRANLSLFCQYAGTSPEAIIQEYEGADDRKFKMKYAQLLQDWIAGMIGEYAQGTIISRATAVRSFFKYRSLPLGFVPEGKSRVTFHNRAILKDEIKTLLAASRAREKAFYAFMAQSGLRPDTIGKLRIKDLEPDWSRGIESCYVHVFGENTKGGYSAYFSFIGADTLHHLIDYFKTRGAPTKDSFIFVNRKGGAMERTLISHLFQDTLKKLREKGVVSYETKTKGKPSELRLYTLRKYFRQEAAHAGPDFVNYWMGHRLSGVDSHYFPGAGSEITSDIIELHRKVYVEKALPYLRLEASVPLETEKQVTELRTMMLQQQKMIDYQNFQIHIYSIRSRMEGNWNVASLKEYLREVNDEMMPRFKQSYKDWVKVATSDYVESTHLELLELRDEISKKIAAAEFRTRVELKTAESDKQKKPE
jgi:integrase